MHYIPFQISISSIFDAKILKRRRFLQHYYRNASTERTRRIIFIIIFFVLSTNAVYCILLEKNKNIYATFLIIFVGEAVFMFQKIILELTKIDNQIDTNCLKNKSLIFIYFCSKRSAAYFCFKKNNCQYCHQKKILDNIL